MSRLLSTISPLALATYAPADGAGGGSSGGEPWYASQGLGLDVGGADKGLADGLAAGGFADLKSALGAAVGAKGKIDAPKGWAETGLQLGDGFFDLGDVAGADKDIAEYLAGKKPPDLKTALRMGINAEKLARDRNAVAMPEKGKEKDWAGWEQLGWVKDKAKYKLDPVDQTKLPPGLLYSQEMEDALIGAAHEARIPLETAKGLRDLLVAQQTKIYDQIRGKGAADIAVTEESLQKDWGVDTARNKELAKRAMQAVAVSPGDVGAIEKLMGAPGVVKTFHKIATLIGEAALPAPNSGGSGLPTTVAGLRSEMNRLTGDKDWMAAFNDPRNPRNREVTAQRQRLIDEIARLEGAK